MHSTGGDVQCKPVAAMILPVRLNSPGLVTVYRQGQRRSGQWTHGSGGCLLVHEFTVNPYLTTECNPLNPLTSGRLRCERSIHLEGSGRSILAVTENPAVFVYEALEHNMATRNADPATYRDQ
jgi:hypothetical protein